MRDSERKLVRDLIELETKWMYRALLLSSVLEHFGYSTRNIMNASKEVLVGYVYREPAEIIRCLQMGGNSE